MSEKIRPEKISFEDFEKMDIRIGRILSAEKIKGAEKLLKLEIDFGKEKRQIVAGIAQDYNKETLENKLVVVIMNLEPKTIFGIKSHGMLLAAEINENNERKAVLLVPEKKVFLGSKIS